MCIELSSNNFLKILLVFLLISSIASAVGATHDGDKDADASNYCGAVATYGHYMGIQGVDFDSISTSTLYSESYQDLTEFYDDMKGKDQKITVELGADYTYEQHVHVWIDWDHDGELKDETAIDLGSCQGNCDLSKTISIPTTAKEGTTLLRVNTEYGLDPAGPCEGGYFGEAEDYSIDPGDSNAAGDSNTPPDAPSNPDPADGASGVSTSPSISALYSDPDGDSGALKYYDGGGELIGSCSVKSGERCSVEYSEAKEKGTYKWYAVADDGQATTSSPEWSFTISSNNPPEVESLLNPSDGKLLEDKEAKLKAEVSDPDNDNLEVKFYNNKTGSLIGSKTVSGTSGGTKVSFTWDSLSRGREYWWNVNVTDSELFDVSDKNRSFSINTLPVTSDVQPIDGSNVGPVEEVNLKFEVSDKESNSLSAYIYNTTLNPELLKAVEGLEDGESVSYTWEGLEEGENYEWKVNLSDGMENSSTYYSFTTESGDFKTELRIDHDYSVKTASLSGSSSLFFSVENPSSRSKNLELMLKGGIPASFPDGATSKKLTMNPQSTTEFRIRVKPETTGDKKLKVVARNTDLGINSTASIPVTVKKYSAVSASKDVPGIGVLQLGFLVLVSTLLYSARL